VTRGRIRITQRLYFSTSIPAPPKLPWKGSVNVLWFVPISEEEKQLAINQGSEWLKSRLPADRWKQA
jgi:hypothetical protein